MSTRSSSHKLIMHWLLSSSVPLTLSSFPWLKLLQVSPHLKVRFLFPASDWTCSLPMALLHLCARSRQTLLINTDANYPFSTVISKIRIKKQELSHFSFFPYSKNKIYGYKIWIHLWRVFGKILINLWNYGFIQDSFLVSSGNCTSAWVLDEHIHCTYQIKICLCWFSKGVNESFSSPMAAWLNCLLC